MKQVIWVLLCNAIIEATFVVCVTLAAIHFDKPAMCWWYVLTLFMGYSLKWRSTDDENERKCGGA